MNRIYIYSWFFYFVLASMGLMLYHALVYQNMVYIIAGMPQILGIFCMGTYCSSLYNYFAGNYRVVWLTYINAVSMLNIASILFLVYHLFIPSFRFRNDPRFYSILGDEPALYSMIVLPAFYYVLVNYRNYKHKFWLSFFCLISSVSLVGYVGMCYAAIIASHKSLLFKFRSALVVIGLFWLSMLVFPSIETRVNDTFDLYTKSNVDLYHINMSTFTISANMFVMKHQLQETPLLGAGLGMYELVHEKFITSVPGAYIFYNSLRQNAKDANSLAVRLLSEFGILGFGFIIYLLLKFRVSSGDCSAISQGIIIYFMVSLLRAGHYFPLSMYFFIVAYYLVFMENKKILGVIPKTT